jgi:AraC-like DNA-binding protein
MVIQGVIELTPHDLKSAEKAKEYIDAHYMSSLTAEDLSEMFSIRLPELHKGMRVITNLPLHNYQIKCRLDKAKALLSGGPELSVKNISHAVGYKRPSHFSQAFKNFIGITPLQYRINAYGLSKSGLGLLHNFPCKILSILQ